MKNKSHRPSGPNQRMLRVGELVRHALAGVFARGEIDDAALVGAVITVPEVRMSSDLKLASAYVMPLGGERAEEIVEALNRHKRFIRGRVAPELDLKFAPDLRFFVDETFEEFGRIDALLRSDRVQQDLRDQDDLRDEDDLRDQPGDDEDGDGR
jgi:ribosome-binding factor A